MRGPGWPDARGWIGIGLFVLTVMVLWMLVLFPELRKDEYFKTIATAIILTGFINGVVSWAFSATKTGGELATSNAEALSAKLAASPPESKDTGQPGEEGGQGTAPDSGGTEKQS